MIVRPLSVESVQTAEVVPAWAAILKTQETLLRECWMIPQPAHAALAGEIAGKLDPKVFPNLSDEVTKAIALHDSGWGPADAVAIQESRGKATTAPASFLLVTIDATVDAWTGSIDIAARVGPLAGYLVSRHFMAILDQSQDPRAALATKFRAQENARQQSLLGKIQLDANAIERLLEALQFCDLLSLYLCCGLQQSVEFPQKANGDPIRLLRDGPESCRLQPNPLSDGETFSISAIRHPRLKGNAPSSAMFALIVE